MKDVQWSGGALSTSPQPDLGGMAVEDSSMLEIDDLNCLQSYASCLSFIASSDIVASKVVSFNGGASSGPASNVVSLDSGSQNILLDGIEADDNRTQPLQRGISSTASHIVVKNEKYGSIASGDSGVQVTESLAPADSLFYTIPASAGFDWTIGGSTIATISDLGLNATVSTAQDLSTTNFPVLDVRNYGVKGDGTQLTTCTGTAGSPNVACTGATFTAADIGKMVNFLGAGSSGSVLTTTVAGCSPSCPSGTVTLATNVLTTSTQLFFYGTDNLAAWCNMMNCTSAAGPNGLYTPSPGRRIFMPRGTYFFSNSIGSRNGDQIVGADQSATSLVLFNSNLYQQLLLPRRLQQRRHLDARRRWPQQRRPRRPVQHAAQRRTDLHQHPQLLRLHHRGQLVRMRHRHSVHRQRRPHRRQYLRRQHLQSHHSHQLQPQ